MTAEIAQLVPIIKRKGSELKRPWHRFSIEECGEKLVPLEAFSIFAFESPPPYQAAGAPYGDKGPWFLREGVAERLKKAAEKLSIIKPGWKIKFYDAYRPLSVQEYMIAHEYVQHARKKGLDPYTVDDATRNQLLEEVYPFWAPPSEDAATPPPHSTGAAFDCTFQNDHGEEVAMGSPIDFIGDESKPEFFANRENDVAAQIYDENRRLLFDVLNNEGFQRHPGEWWHFSYGDQLWAWQMAENGQPAQAVYGRV